MARFGQGCVGLLRDSSEMKSDKFQVPTLDLLLRGCEVLAWVFKPLIRERARGGKVEIVGAVYERFPVWRIKTDEVSLVSRVTQTAVFVGNPNVGCIIAFGNLFPTETPPPVLAILHPASSIILPCSVTAIFAGKASNQSSVFALVIALTPGSSAYSFFRVTINDGTAQYMQPALVALSSTPGAPESGPIRSLPICPEAFWLPVSRKPLRRAYGPSQRRAEPGLGGLRLLTYGVIATVRQIPTGLLISCATPATSRPSAASYRAMRWKMATTKIQLQT